MLAMRRRRGWELDAKFRLDELHEGALPLTVRSNLSLYSSSVSGVPGPNNRIDQQPRASANLGGEYRLRSLPLQLGGNLSWMPPYTVQQTETQRNSVERAAAQLRDDEHGAGQRAGADGAGERA